MPGCSLPKIAYSVPGPPRTRSTSSSVATRALIVVVAVGVPVASGVAGVGLKEVVALRVKVGISPLGDGVLVGVLASEVAVAGPGEAVGSGVDSGRTSVAVDRTGAGEGVTSCACPQAVANTTAKSRTPTFQGASTNFTISEPPPARQTPSLTQGGFNMRIIPQRPVTPLVNPGSKQGAVFLLLWFLTNQLRPSPEGPWGRARW